MTLRKDIINIPSHIFGERKRCKERDRIYENVTDTNKKNYSVSEIVRFLPQNTECNHIFKCR